MVTEVLLKFHAADKAVAMQNHFPLQSLIVKNAPLDPLYLIMYKYIITAIILVTFRHTSSLLQVHQSCR